MNEIEIKISKVRKLLAERHLDALVVQRSTNFAWLTGGASSSINLADDFGEGALVITPDSRYLVTNNIEAPRFIQEEHLEDQEWEFIVGNWYETFDLIGTITPKMRLASDGFYWGESLNQDLKRLRMNLLPEEQDRFRHLGRSCAEAMKAAIDQVRPGQSEYEIAAILSAETQRRGMTPTVNLIATDQRIFDFRHPLPTDKKLDQYAMLILCGRQYGLVCSITRLIYFGSLSEELKDKAQAVAKIDAAMITTTHPGIELNQIFKVGQKEYELNGYKDEWRKHHQGGLAGYLSRELIATEKTNIAVAEGQVFAWNPSISGVKSEDTFLVGAEENYNLTKNEEWPAIEVQVDNEIVSRPAILEMG
jgi:Xaa-Pro aminopeptidase